MPKTLEAKRGSSLFEATFLNARHIEVCSVELLSVGSSWGSLKSTWLPPSETKNGFSYDEILEALKQSETVVVTQKHHSRVGKWRELSEPLEVLLNPKMESGFVLGFVLLYTEPIETIRASAKELRADKAVARAAKMPKKPKASLKERKDTI